MENNKEDLIVVLAGYKDKMETFYSFIPARRRSAQHAYPANPSTLPPCHPATLPHCHTATLPHCVARRTSPPPSLPPPPRRGFTVRVCARERLHTPQSAA